MSTLAGENEYLAHGYLPRPVIPAEDSGRLEFAHWLTDPRNPLTARVMVNRIWHWHFGRGIVATTSASHSNGSRMVAADVDRAKCNRQPADRRSMLSTGERN